ncbi:MAG: hypothetical protein ACRDB9_00955 [Cetobacterium sp.]
MRSTEFKRDLWVFKLESYDSIGVYVNGEYIDTIKILDSMVGDFEYQCNLWIINNK